MGCTFGRFGARYRFERAAPWVVSACRSDRTRTLLRDCRRLVRLLAPALAAAGLLAAPASGAGPDGFPLIAAQVPLVRANMWTHGSASRARSSPQLRRAYHTGTHREVHHHVFSSSHASGFDAGAALSDVAVAATEFGGLDAHGAHQR